MLPIIREIVELIFQEGLIKILFTIFNGDKHASENSNFYWYRKFDGWKEDI